MNYLVAVSGGVDSVVLLDMMVKEEWGTLIVAHFDHGIREESAVDAVFVRHLADQYGLPFETRREELGAGASEELARDRRYTFLREMAKKHEATIATAHHADDVRETIAINISRGTGWRGLAAMNSIEIKRPLVHWTKRMIMAYALEEGLSWHEDSTNQDSRYLRNRLRMQLARLSPETKMWLGEYWQRQCELASEIDAETERLLGRSPYSRYLFTHIDEAPALELLAALFKKEIAKSPTLPQRQRLLHAIKVAKPGTLHDAGDGVRIRFTRTEFIVEHPL